MAGTDGPISSIFIEDCAFADNDVPEKMPKATETKNKFCIRKLLRFYT